MEKFIRLFQQGAQITIIAMGLIFVLLLGEIDLSAGFTRRCVGRDRLRHPAVV